MNSGTATMKRKAVNVIGGMVPRPSLVMGMESPHMTASRSIAPKFLAVSGDGESKGIAMFSVMSPVQHMCVDVMAKALLPLATNHLFSHRV